jgi:Carboxypeptidase regulatory-like domain
MILRNSVLFLFSCALVCSLEANAAEGHVIRGVVTTTDDTPLANAKVVLRSDETGQAEYGTLTERDGRFFLHEVGNGRYRFIVEKEGYVDTSAPAVEEPIMAHRASQMGARDWSVMAAILRVMNNGEGQEA